ncbi:MAG: PLP-dependent aminotransferase family protein [Actinobacteria bacterium]|nr:PLP-dependent aminotransferase family protein [Actinomycetota bacterium]
MKTTGGRLLAGIVVDRDSEMPIYRQLYLQVRGLILDGTLRSGTRLPSTRTLIAELAVSRATVVAAFEQLSAEGFLDARPGDGTYIAPTWGEPVTAARPGRPALAARGAITSARGAELFSHAPSNWTPRESESFVASQIAVDAFPSRTWRRLLTHHASRADATMLGYCDPHGLRTLREAVADYLVDVRGLECHPGQVVITSGAQHALTVLALLLLGPGEPVLVEDPGHIAGRMAFQAQGCVVSGVPVDDEGAVPPSAGTPGRLAYLTPSRQHPLGTIMSLARRAEWIAWAARENAWIVEDDGDSELRYRGRLLPTLFGLDLTRHVLYVGSFSKILSPSLRLGYVVLPEDLVDAFADASSVLSRPPATLLQAALADFVEDGHLHAHLRRMRQLYAARQDALHDALTAQLDGRLRAQPVDAGLHLIGWLDGDVDDQEVSAGLAAQGVYTYPLGDYRVERRMPPALLIGFGGTAAEQMPVAVSRMARALDQLRTARNWTGPSGG